MGVNVFRFSAFWFPYPGTIFSLLTVFFFLFSKRFLTPLGPFLQLCFHHGLKVYPSPPFYTTRYCSSVTVPLYVRYCDRLFFVFPNARLVLVQWGFLFSYVTVQVPLSLLSDPTGSVHPHVRVVTPSSPRFNCLPKFPSCAG